jgi:hypothetical protein
MSLDTIGLDMTAKDPEGRPGAAGNGDPEKWLAALEKSAFEIKDDSVNFGQRKIFDPESLPDEVRTGSALDALRPAVNTAAAQLASMPVSAQPAIAPASGFGATPTAGLPSAPGQIGGSGFEQSKLAMLRPQVNGPQGARAAQRFDAMMNQMRFTDLNISVTRAGDNVTLWIRDFKQKYGQELFHWVRDLQGLMQENGTELSRIMVNGRQLNHVNQLLGDAQWQ